MVTLFFTTCTRAIALSFSLSCLYILSVILGGRILYYYHRFLLKYTFFWHQRRSPPSVEAVLTTSRTCRCQARGTTFCFLVHSHCMIALLKSLKTCWQSIAFTFFDLSKQERIFSLETVVCLMRCCLFQRPYKARPKYGDR